MVAPNPLKTPLLQFRALLVLVLAVSVLFAMIIRPYFGAVCWAVFIAIIFSPVHERILRGTRGRTNIAAAATLVLVLVIVILPLALVAASITQEASVLVAKLRSGDVQIGAYWQRMLEALPSWGRRVLEHFGLTDLSELQARVLAVLGNSSQIVTSRVLGIGHVTLKFVVALLLMLYMLFFLLRDGEELAQSIARCIPLDPQHTRRLFQQFATVVRATVKGNIVVALVQGALGALAFWVLGVVGPVLWGAVMAVLSLLPAVGSFMVWGPVALYFLFTGATVKGIGLLVWGALVIGVVDNVLRPLLVGKDTRMPDYLILVATLGGITVFGLNGFVIGPVIAAVFLVSWEMLASVRQQPPMPQEPPAGGD